MNALRKVPVDVWLQPVLIVVATAGYLLWRATTTLGSTELAQLNWSALGASILGHVELAFCAAVIVVLIGIPLGILLTRAGFRRYSGVVVTAANAGQAAPAIGLIVLFAMWMGTGFRTVVVVLVVYSLLPILQNTILALNQVDARVIEAAKGIGFSPLRVLIRVELPLAIPLILNGVRIALVILVATATLGTFIDGGGLGVLITTGMNLYLPKVLLSGAILVTLLALTVDWLARLAGLAATPKGMS